MKATRSAPPPSHGFVESTSTTLPVDTLVFAFTEWREFIIRDEAEFQALTPVPGLDVSHYLGALGMPAITAYYGLKEVVKVQPGESVVVSGAAGATGCMAVQIARMLGYRVYRDCRDGGEMRLGEEVGRGGGVCELWLGVV